MVIVLERVERPTIKYVAIFGFIVLSAVAILVVAASVLSLIDPLSGWVYVGLLMIAFLSLVVIFVSPNHLEANIPGFGPVTMDGAESPEERKTPDRERFSTPEDFEEYAELTRSLSTELSAQLFQIDASDYSNPFEATAKMLSQGIEDSNPVQETLQLLEADLEAREFILNSENHDMEVVNIEDNQVIAKMDDDQHPPKPRLEFKLYTNTAVDIGGTTETFREWVGTVRVEEVDDPLCVMSAISWDDALSEDPAERSAELMRQGSWVEIGLEGVENIDWDTMGEAYQRLKTLREEGELTYAN